MADLVVIVPSRGRPDAVAELAQQCQRTCTADTVLLVVVDLDDPTLSRYAAPAGTTVFFAWAPAASGHVGAINFGAARAIDEFRPSALAKLDDDHRPRSRGWDASLLEALHDMGSGIAYGNDLFQGENLPTAPALTADIVQALGYMGPPTLTHLYVDDFWRDLGREAGCLRYLPGIIVEHMHPMAGKAVVDDGYARVNAPSMYAADGAAYRDFVQQGHFAADVAKVRALRGGR